MTRQFTAFILLLAVIGLSACQPTKPMPEKRPDPALVSAAKQAEQSGDFQSAAQHYLTLAQHTSQPAQSEYYLHAAQNFWQAGNSDKAMDALSHLVLSSLSKAQQFDARILKAQLSLVLAQPDNALQALDAITLDTLSPAQQATVLKLRIQAYDQIGNLPEKANSLIALDPLLPDQEHQENQQKLWQTLMAMTPQSLDIYNPGLPADVRSGWYELATIIQTYRDRPQALAAALDNWQRDYPNHPADPALYQDVLTARTHLPTELSLIAVLLPETGRYQQAADAIRQGLLAAYYQSQSNSELRFYPVDNQSHPVEAQYQQAVEDGADIVIGPLAKASVKQLAEHATLTVPVLALNHIDLTVANRLFQFGLAPEDDAQAVADYANQHQFQRALALAPQSNWGHRVYHAFEQRWIEHSGVLLNRAFYPRKENDYSAILKPLLGLDQSIARHRRLQRVLGKKLEFEPRRRQDIDFIFLAAKPLKARQLVPQLKFHRTGRLPIIATSHAFSGHDNPQQDIDLNGLIITDIPWILDSDKQTDPVYGALKQQHSADFDHFVRLYALGADAYRIIPQLNQLSHTPQAGFDGATGHLTIDAQSRIHRQTQWGIFKSGTLTPLHDND